MEAEDILWRIASDVVAAEELSRQIAKKVEVKVSPAPKMRTVTYRKTNVKIPAIIIDEYGEGELKEFLILSAYKEIRVIMNVDGQELYNNDFDWFLSIAQEVVGIAAYRRLDGNYVLHITNIKFTRRIRVRVEPLPILTVEEPRIAEVFWKYDVAR